MPSTAEKSEKTQLYLRSGQLDRLHRIKGENRGVSISGLVAQAVDLFLAEHDRKTGRSNHRPTPAA